MVKWLLIHHFTLKLPSQEESFHIRGKTQTVRKHIKTAELGPETQAKWRWSSCQSTSSTSGFSPQVSHSTFISKWAAGGLWGGIQRGAEAPGDLMEHEVMSAGVLKESAEPLSESGRLNSQVLTLWLVEARNPAHGLLLGPWEVHLHLYHSHFAPSTASQLTDCTGCPTGTNQQLGSPTNKQSPQVGW